MEIQNEINNNLNNSKNNFLNSTIGKTINAAIDFGLKTILPDLIENQIIEIKDALIKNGLKDGIETAVESAIDFGKSAIGIFTGNFENMTQVRTAISDGGIIDSMSNVLDKVVDAAYKGGYIDRNITSLIKKGKDMLLENMTSNIKNELNKQTSAVEKLERYVENWKEYCQKRDFEGMTKEYEKIQLEIDNVVPLENIVKETREVEILHNLIKNNGQNFEITDLESQVVEKLAI